MSKRRSLRNIVKAALDGAHDAGVDIARVELSESGGKIVMVVGQPGGSAIEISENQNPLDEVLTNAAQPKRAS